MSAEVKPWVDDVDKVAAKLYQGCRRPQSFAGVKGGLYQAMDDMMMKRQ